MRHPGTYTQTGIGDQEIRRGSDDVPGHPRQPGPIGDGEGLDGWTLHHLGTQSAEHDGLVVAAPVGRDADGESSQARCGALRSGHAAVMLPIVGQVPFVEPQGVLIEGSQDDVLNRGRGRTQSADRDQSGQVLGESVDAGRDGRERH
jgi:hypothetical protein